MLYCPNCLEEKCLEGLKYDDKNRVLRCCLCTFSLSLDNVNELSLVLNLSEEIEKVKLMGRYSAVISLLAKFDIPAPAPVGKIAWGAGKRDKWYVQCI